MHTQRHRQCGIAILNPTNFRHSKAEQTQTRTRVNSILSYRKTNRTCVLSLFLVSFLLVLVFLVCSCVLILLVLGNQVVHVAFSFGELHLVHSLPGVPMQEGLPAEHSRELLTDLLEYVNILYQIDMRSGNKRQDLGLPLAIFAQAFLRTSKKIKECYLRDLLACAFLRTSKKIKECYLRDA
jgi:hypothetical protein